MEASPWWGFMFEGKGKEQTGKTHIHIMLRGSSSLQNKAGKVAREPRGAGVPV